jgi:hypothetical protein
MKIRTGFVSNSSSSSFVIATKGDLKEEILRIAPKTDDSSSPFKLGGSIEEAIKVFWEFAEEVDMKDEDEFEYEMGYTLDEYKDEHPEVMNKVLNEGWKLYVGSVSDETGEVGELIAVAMEIDYKDDSIIIQKDSYY